MRKFEPVDRQTLYISFFRVEISRAHFVPARLRHCGFDWLLRRRVIDELWLRRF